MSPGSLAFPPLLQRGARVALVAPAGHLAGQPDVDTAVEQARTLGWDPVVAPHATSQHAYFAGTDAERLHDLNAAIADRAIDGIWCLRGGYGAMRILDGIDYDALRRHPKPFIGFSDITAIHAAIHLRCGIASHHGPTARGRLTSFSRDSLVRAVADGADSGGLAAGATTLVGGVARGRLAGGNLALVASLCGTPYAIDFADAIVVLEDVFEPVYRIDRMFQQLLLCGLRECAGLVIGTFSGMPDKGIDSGRTLDALFAEVAEELGVPCIAGAPIGHIDDQWTLPLGRAAELDAAARTLHVLPS